MSPTDNQKKLVPAKPPRDPHSIGTMLSTIALAIGVGVFGYYALDGHSHTCESCGQKWRHLGAFNLGDPIAHTCKQCGTVQWWKDGMPHVFRTALRQSPANVMPGSFAQLHGHEDSRPALHPAPIVALALSRQPR